MKVILGLILFMCLVVVNAQAAKSPKLKVRIAKSLSKVKVSGMDLKRYIWPKKSFKSYQGAKRIHFNCRSKKLRSSKKPIRLASINSPTGMIKWDNERYKGVLHIQTSEKFDGCDIINELSLEDYLSTLLPKEMNAKWPMEALKAQAVAARSYALYKLKTKQVSKSKGFRTNYDLENSEKHQVNGSYQDATRRTIKATRQTRGEVLTLLNSKLTPVFFHSKCGGRTRTPDQVWRNKVQGYRSVDCPFCHKHGMKDWKRSFNKLDMNYSMLKVLKNYNNDSIRMRQSSMSLLKDSKIRHKIQLRTGNKLRDIKKSRLRSVLGRKSLPSNNYKIRESNGRYLVSGSGYGHGVGMCQFGVKELALKGMGYREILAYYFPNLKLKKLY